MNDNKGIPFRGLDDDFLRELLEGKLHTILEFERKHRKSFMVEIRNNFLDIYFLGHGIEVKSRQRRGEYYLSASNRFNPRSILSDDLKRFVKDYGPNRWQISFDDIEKEHPEILKEIMTKILLKIVEHRKGNISEGVSEINHFIGNRAIEKNGILVIDRQVVYPRTREGRIDLLGLKRLKSGKFSFVVLELKNKNNTDIAHVFTEQVKRYIDIVFNHYEDFKATYEKILKQKIKLRLLRRIRCDIASKNEILKKDIEGLVILDSYNIKSDLRDNGLLQRALKDWENLGEEYRANLFLKTNVLDSTFFMDYQETDNLVKKYQKNNL